MIQGQHLNVIITRLQKNPSSSFNERDVHHLIHKSPPLDYILPVFSHLIYLKTFNIIILSTPELSPPVTYNFQSASCFLILLMHVTIQPISPLLT